MSAKYLRTGDNRTAIVRGVSSTARLGLATAILVDVTVVRLVSVPATMTLLGRSNWCLPGSLDRAVPGGRSDTVFLGRRSEVA